jgi:SAM-dependent methyltransferase
MTATTPVRGLDADVVDGCRVLSVPDLGYADGAEPRLLEIVRSASDLSSSSQELANAASDWGTTYSLVPTRANVIRGLDLPPEARVLEIGCGCGPITRYLGEQAAVVDSVEPMPARAAVARARTRDLDTVEVFVGTLDDVPPVPTYDVVVVIGVLEYVGRGALEPAPYLSFLRQCHAVLKDGGTLVVAIENPLGVKYLTGAVEDHTNRPFDSLEGYALESPARTFPRRVLGAMLVEAGFAPPEVLGAFPDYKLPRAVMSDALFRASDQLAEGLPRFPSPDYLVPRLQLADEKLTWGTLVASGVGEHFANSFIALAAKGDGAPLWNRERLAVLFNSERQPEFAVRSEVHRRGSDLEVVRTALFPERVATGDADDDVRHVPADVEPVVAGKDLLQAVLDEPARRAELLRRWAALVPDEEWAPVDLVPHNVVLTPDSRLVAIDQEWRVRGYARDAVLMRGLFLSAVQLASRTRPERLRPANTVIELVHALAEEVGLSVDEKRLDEFCDLESAFQARVNTTDPTRTSRRLRSADELRKVLGQSFAEVRGGERFDFQWQRAQRDIDDLHAGLARTEADLAEYRRAYDEVAAEAAGLRARMPVALAKRVARGVLARAGLRPRG